MAQKRLFATLPPAVGDDDGNETAKDVSGLHRLTFWPAFRSLSYVVVLHQQEDRTYSSYILSALLAENIVGNSILLDEHNQFIVRWFECRETQ